MKAKFRLALVLGLFFLIPFSFFWSRPKKVSPLFKITPASLFGPLLKIKEEPSILMAVGDVMLGRSVNAKMRSLNDFTYPFQKTADFLKTADLTLINLEAPFYQPCPITNEGLQFCADLLAVKGLVFAGIDIANLANNHLNNYGSEGVSLTKQILQENSIGPLEEKLIIKTIKGTKLGFLGFDLTSGYQEEKILAIVKEAKPKVDLLIVSFHWGMEYAQEPTNKQINLAHQVIEAGANLILGHHPHVIQKVEDYQGGQIVYSLGNFIFDQPWSEATKKGLVGVFTFENKKLVKSEFKKVYLQDFCQPEFID
ncbi:MAG: CapA family protein [Candidatus Marinimicrobia bacterium]|nr:CapA family protein [Candidatus Neomarinimicrobiota bacterium]